MASSPTLPTFFLVGAPRAGTTSLYGYLTAHPQVYMSPIKEPTYFARTLITPQFFAHRRRPRLNLRAYLNSPTRDPVLMAYLTEWEDYVRLFDRVTSEKAIGEASTFYLQCPAAPADIHGRIPDARIIIGLRHPVERAYSEYLMKSSVGLLRGSFIDAVAAEREDGYPLGGLIAGGLYTEPVKRYLDCFGVERVFIFLDEDLHDDSTLRQRLGAFLGIDPDLGPAQIERRNAGFVARAGSLNYWLYQTGVKAWLARLAPNALKAAAKRRYYAPPAARVTADDRRRVAALFEADLASLEPLIGRSLSRWRE